MRKQLALAAIMTLTLANGAFANTLEGWQQFKFGMTPNMVERATAGNAYPSPNDTLSYNTEINEYSAWVVFFFAGNPLRLTSLTINLSHTDPSAPWTKNDDQFFLSHLVAKYGAYSRASNTQLVLGQPMSTPTTYEWLFRNGFEISYSAGLLPTLSFGPTLTANPSPKEGF